MSSIDLVADDPPGQAAGRPVVWPPSRNREEASWKAGEAIAEILKREGVEIIFGYPVNHILEFAARAGIRPIIVRQERIGLHMADAMSRLTSGEKIGVFAMQHGPGAENAFGGVAQAYGEAVPILVLPMGYPRRIAHVQPNFNSVLNMRHVTKSAEPVDRGRRGPEHPAARVHPPQDRPRRAGAGRGAGRRVRRGGAGAARLPARDDCRGSAPDPDAVREVARRLAGGEAAGDLCRPGRALRARLGRAEAARRAARGAGHHQPRRQERLPGEPQAGARLRRQRDPGDRSHHFLKHADLIFGIGCSFTKTNFGVDMPAGKAIIHATLDPMDVNKDVECELALIGDAQARCCEALLADDRARGRRSRAGPGAGRRRDQGGARTLARQVAARSSPPTRRRSTPTG